MGTRAMRVVVVAGARPAVRVEVPGVAGAVRATERGCRTDRQQSDRGSEGRDLADADVHLYLL